MAPTVAPPAGRAAVAAMTWNVYHGRDFPPSPGLFTLRSRLLRIPEHDGTHVQLNRSLLAEFAGMIAGAAWDVCLLQEVPPAWARPLTQRTGAHGHRVLTSRNQLGALRRLAGRWNPDLLGAAEGGSNLILIRAPWRALESRSLLLNPLRERGLFEERRRMGFCRLGSPAGDLCVANLHASTGPRPQTEREVLRAARAAVDWAGKRPLLLGGDFNVRPRASAVFDQLERRYELSGPTASAAIDHLLARGLDAAVLPVAWPPEQRELIVQVPGAEGRLRLSDHAPVTAVFNLSAAEVR